LDSGQDFRARGLANDDPALPEWSKLLANWFRVRGVLK
jgi:hypothetical protein